MSFIKKINYVKIEPQKNTYSMFDVIDIYVENAFAPG